MSRFGVRPATHVQLPSRALILTVYASYARETGGWLSVAHLVRLMAGLDVDEEAVRAAVSRLKRRGMLEAQRIDGSPGYALTAAANEILALGDRRIFFHPSTSVDTGWVLIVFSIPERQGGRPHVCRSLRKDLGFGTVTSGTWIAPAHVREEAVDAIKRQGLANFVRVFDGRYLGYSDLVHAVAQWWDLNALQSMYRTFIDVHRPVLARWLKGDGSGVDAFVDYVRTLTAWRRLPYLDPGLPRELLPAHWKGGAAATLFERLREVLAEPAARYVTNLVTPS